MEVMNGLRTSREDILKIIHTARGGWIVSSSPFGCIAGYSKVFLRRKIGRSGGLKLTNCIPDDKAKELKRKVKRALRESRLATL